MIVYHPCTIFNAWKSNTTYISWAQIVLLNFCSHKMGSQAIFILLAYAVLNEVMASLRSLSFSKWEKAFQGMLPYPQARISRICNIFSRATFTTFIKGGFLASSSSLYNLLQLIPFYYNNDPCTSCGLLLVSLDDHY